MSKEQLRQAQALFDFDSPADVPLGATAKPAPPSSRVTTAPAVQKRKAVAPTLLKISIKNRAGHSSAQRPQQAPVSGASTLKRGSKSTGTFKPHRKFNTPSPMRQIAMDQVQRRMSIRATSLPFQYGCGHTCFSCQANGVQLIYEYIWRHTGVNACG